MESPSDVSRRKIRISFLYSFAHVISRPKCIFLWQKATPKKQLPTLKIFQSKIRAYIATGEAIKITTKQRKCWTSTRKNKIKARFLRFSSLRYEFFRIISWIFSMNGSIYKLTSVSLHKFEENISFHSTEWKKSKWLLLYSSPLDDISLHHSRFSRLRQSKRYGTNQQIDRRTASKPKKFLMRVMPLHVTLSHATHAKNETYNWGRGQLDDLIVHLPCAALW